MTPSLIETRGLTRRLGYATAVRDGTVAAGAVAAVLTAAGGVRVGTRAMRAA